MKLFKALVAPGSGGGGTISQQARAFEIISTGKTSARTGELFLGKTVVATPVVWLGQSLKSRVRFTNYTVPNELPLPILVNFAELRNKSAALRKSRECGLHRVLAHAGPILLNSGGYQFQKGSAFDLCPSDLANFYNQCGADMAVALDHPLSPAVSWATNNRRWHRSLENLAAMHNPCSPYMLMPVVHGYTVGQIRRCCNRIKELLGTPCVVGIGSMVPLLKASHIGGTFRYRRENGSIGNHVDFIGDAIAEVRRAFQNSMVHVFGAGGIPDSPGAVCNRRRLL